MCTGISWQSYLLITGASSAIYYFYVAVRYYRDDLAAWFTNKASRRPVSATTENWQVQYHSHPPEAVLTPDGAPGNDANEYDELEHLIGRVQKTIGDAATRKAKPEELKQYLALVFQEYPSLKNDGMRPAINELVASECAKQNIALSEAEADRLWEQ